MTSQKFCVYHEVPSMLAFHRSALWLIALVLYVLGSLNFLWAHEPNTHPPKKTMTAVRVNSPPPKIDGVLDDEVWQYTPAFTGFTQKEPNEGEPATESTTVQVAYDDEALYIGIIAYDREPDKIVAQLTRRDQQVEGDVISVSLDPYHDHQTGNYFKINPIGWLGDGNLYNDTEWDNTWDGVWEARATIYDNGWAVEYKIPYHVLRFSPKEEYTWGINVDRFISRKKEHVYWVMVPKKESGWVSRFGHLEGIKDIHPPTHLGCLPFTMAKSTFEPESSTNPDGRELFSSAGLDLRYGLTSNLSLNATLNPDFGQVEADPAVLNLSVFETLFQERRPFFVEGAKIFQTPIQLFYSRRIGKRPEHFSIPSGNRTIDRPEATTILGAAKLTGKTASKNTFGIMEAVTAAEYATIERTITKPGTGMEQPERREHRIEPLTNYFVGRMQQDIFDGNSTVGLLTTAVNRDDAESAYTGGVDWNLKWHNNDYEFSGQVAGSRVGSSDNRQSGYAVTFELAKRSGWTIGYLKFEGFSPGFNPNDLGFIGRVNKVNPWLWVGFRKTKPWGPFHRLQFYTNGFAAWNYRYNWGGQTYRWVNLSKGLSFNFSTQLKNFWWVGGSVTPLFEAMNDQDTRGGPLIVNPARTITRVWLTSDSRKPISVNLFFVCGGYEGGSTWRALESQVTLRPAANVEIRIGPMYNWNFTDAQWVTNIDDDGDGTNDHFVYGELTSKVLDVTTRVDVTFTPNLSLQFYLQPFTAVGDYKNFKELARPASYEFTSYSGLRFNPDFNRRSLRSNLVLRWEYRPGSTLFLVWSQSRSTLFNDPSFCPLNSLKYSFSDDGQNIFLVKLNYWLGI